MQSVGTQRVRASAFILGATAIIALAPPPYTAWYFALPHHDTTGLRKLAASYTIGAAREIEREGYRMAIYPLVRAGTIAGVR